VYPIPFEIDKKKFVYNILALKHLSEDLIFASTSFKMQESPTIPEVRRVFGQKMPVQIGKQVG
jgi:hypothetical protein